MLLRKLVITIACLGFLGLSATAHAQEGESVWDVQVKLNPSLTAFDFFQKFIVVGVPLIHIAEVSEANGVGILDLNVKYTAKEGAEAFLSKIHDKKSQEKKMFLSTTVMETDAEPAPSLSDLQERIESATYVMMRLSPGLTALRLFSELNAGGDRNPSIRIFNIYNQTNPFWIVLSYSNREAAEDVMKQVRMKKTCTATKMNDSYQLDTEITSRSVALYGSPEPAIRRDTTNRTK